MHENHKLCKGGAPVRDTPPPTFPALAQGGVLIPPLTALSEGICHMGHMVGLELELGPGWVFPSLLVSYGYRVHPV